MKTQLISDVAVSYDVAALAAGMALTPDFPEYEEFGELAVAAAGVARPCAVYCELPVLRRVHDCLEVPGGVLQSALLARQCAGDRLFLFVAGCGPELDALRRDDDPLRAYWLDVLKMRALLAVSRQLQAAVELAAGRALQSLDPTDDENWPIAGLRDIFDILGSAATAAAKVTLTEHLYLLPNKSRAGVYFEAADREFSACDYCSMWGRCERRHEE